MGIAGRGVVNITNPCHNKDMETKEQQNNTENNEKRVYGKPFPKGVSGNPKGRPKGRKDWSTVYWEALQKIAEANDKTSEEIHIEIIQKGILEARKGNFKFYKDVVDREYGQPTKHIDHTTDGEQITGFEVVFKSFKKDVEESENTSQ